MKVTRGQIAKGAFLALALIVGKELGAGLPDTSQALRAFEISGTVGTPVELRTASVEVQHVHLATTLITPDAGYRTPGLWTVARVTVIPKEAPVRLLYTAIRSLDQRTWEGGSRAPLDCPATPPGLPVTCDLRFEVPSDALAGAELMLGTESDLRHDSIAVINLGLTGEHVDAALAHEEPLDSGRPQVGVSGAGPEGTSGE